MAPACSSADYCELFQAFARCQRSLLFMALQAQYLQLIKPHICLTPTQSQTRWYQFNCLVNGDSWVAVFRFPAWPPDRTFDLPRLVNWLFRRATQRQSVREHSWCLAPPHRRHCRLKCGNGTWVWQFSVKNWKLCCSNQCEIDSGINLSKFFFIFYCFNLVHLFYFYSICNFVMFMPTAVLCDYTREHANTCNNNDNNNSLSKAISQNLSSQDSNSQPITSPEAYPLGHWPNVYSAFSLAMIWNRNRFRQVHVTNVVIVILQGSAFLGTDDETYYF